MLKSKKITSFLLLVILVAGAVTLSPYTITRLVARAEGDATTTPAAGLATVVATLPSDLTSTSTSTTDTAVVATDIATTTSAASSTPLETVVNAVTSLVTTVASTVSDLVSSLTGTGTTTPSSEIATTTPEAITTKDTAATTQATTVASSSPVLLSVPTITTIATTTPDTAINTLLTVPPPPPVVIVDPAIAPGIATMKILISGGPSPSLPIHITFVAVGGVKTEQTIDSVDGGSFTQNLGSGRYYADIIADDPRYVLQGDGPHFFINASEVKDVGTYTLMYR